MRPCCGKPHGAAHTPSVTPGPSVPPSCPSGELSEGATWGGQLALRAPARGPARCPSHRAHSPSVGLANSLGTAAPSSSSTASRPTRTPSICTSCSPEAVSSSDLALSPVRRNFTTLGKRANLIAMARTCPLWPRRAALVPKTGETLFSCDLERWNGWELAFLLGGFG